MLTTALVPLDGSPESAQAVPYAETIVAENGRITLLQVVQQSDLDLLDIVGEVQPGHNLGAYLEDLRTRLEAIARDGDNRLTWQTEVEHGDPAEEILRAITRSNADVVVMTTHGRGAIGRALFGSVADRIARSSPVPVLLIRPESAEGAPEKPTIRRVVVPLDGSPLAEEALPHAMELARRWQVPLHLVRVINLATVLAPLSFFAAPGVSPRLYEETFEQVRGEATEYLTGAAARCTGAGVANVTWVVLDGSPFDTISEVTEPSDVLVLTSHGRGGVRRWLLGSVAEKLVREAPAPVLLVPASNREQAVPEGSE